LSRGFYDENPLEIMGLFLSIDGIDGVGKTTQQQRLAQWLQAQGYPVVTCRDPGSTDLGERLRTLILEPNGPRMNRLSEMFLYMAARAQLVEEVIRPALQSGAVVVSDRYLLANVAYQAYGGGLDVEHVWQVGRLAVQGIYPDRVFLLDIPVEEAIRRRGERTDRMEAHGRAFLERVREGFLREAAKDSQHTLVIDARQPIDRIATLIQDCVRAMLAHPSDADKLPPDHRPRDP
jgi:dTMP kinase